MQETLAQSFVRYVHEDLLQIKQPHFDIAFRLSEAKKLGYAEELGFANIYELSEKEFGFKRSSTAAYIAVAERFMNGMQVLEAFDEFSFSQLVEMLPLSEFDARRVDAGMTVKKIREWRKDHKFVQLGDNPYCMYGSLSEKDKQAYDEQEARRKEERKLVREEGSVQTSGQNEEVEDLQDFEKNVVVVPEVAVAKSNRLGLKNKAEREKWLERYKDWGVWLSVPELNLTCYKYVFANGFELVVSESATWDDYNLGASKRACLVRYHLVDGKRTFFDLSGVSKTYVLGVMTEFAKEI